MKFYPNESEFIEKYKELKSSRKMGQFYNVSYSTIQDYAKKINFKNKYRNELLESEKQYVIDNYYKSSSTNLAEKFGVSKSLIKKVWRENNLKNKKCYSYYSNFNYFENIDSKDKAYFLGFISADGCVLNRKNHQKSLSIKIHAKDKNLLEKFKKYIQSGNPIIEYEKTSINNTKSKVVELTIVSDKLCNDLSKFNIIPNKTWTFEPINIPNNFIPHFIRGYFDGDGCISIYKNGRIVCSFVGNKKTMEFIAKELDNKSIKYSLIQDNREYTDDFYQLKISETNTSLFLKYLYNDCNDLYLNRKKERSLLLN